MVRVGHKMCQAQLAEIQAREEALDSVMRETEEEWQVALIVSSVLDEALGDIRLQYEAHAEDLAKRIRDARGILDAAAAHERQARRSTPRCGPGRRRSRLNAGPWISVPAPRRSLKP